MAYVEGPQPAISGGAAASVYAQAQPAKVTLGIASAGVAASMAMNPHARSHREVALDMAVKLAGSRPFRPDEIMLMAQRFELFLATGKTGVSEPPAYEAPKHIGGSYGGTTQVTDAIRDLDKRVTGLEIGNRQQRVLSTAMQEIGSDQEKRITKLEQANLEDELRKHDERHAVAKALTGMVEFAKANHGGRGLKSEATVSLSIETKGGDEQPRKPTLLAQALEASAETDSWGLIQKKNRPIS